MQNCNKRLVSSKSLMNSKGEMYFYEKCCIKDYSHKSALYLCPPACLLCIGFASMISVQKRQFSWENSTKIRSHLLDSSFVWWVQISCCDRWSDNLANLFPGYTRVRFSDFSHHWAMLPPSDSFLLLAALLRLLWTCSKIMHRCASVAITAT